MALGKDESIPRAAVGLALGSPLGKLVGYEATYTGEDEKVAAVPAAA